MNKVFEAYVKALLEAYFNVEIKTQKPIGNLFPKLDKGKVQQRADYFWKLQDNEYWIGDAKYKHLSKNQKNSLLFIQIPEEENDSFLPAGKILNPGDIRQLTVYAEIYRKNEQTFTSPNILLLYPFVGEGDFKSDTTDAWNGSKFTLCPVKMRRSDNLKDALPSNMIRSTKDERIYRDALEGRVAP
jgi:hypothetical protein